MRQILLPTLALPTLALLVFAGCSSQDRSPDAIRRQSADATATAIKDTKAVVQGVADGVKNRSGSSDKGPVNININHASESDLESLPGIDATAAHRIISGRPYDNASDLLHRRIVTKAEYDRISERISAQ